MMPQYHRQQGLTLLNLLMGLVVLGILSGIAIPGYQQYLIKARRDTAQSALLVLAQQMQGVYSDTGSYMPNATAPALPYTQAPIHGSRAYYDLSLSSIDGQSYVLRATPKDVQAGDGFLELTHTGQQRWDKNDNGSIEANERQW